jgi:hypothetical protein
MTDLPQTLEQLVSMLKISMNVPVQSATDHDPVTLAAGSDPALTISGQELHLVDVVTATEFGAHLIPNAHHNPVTIAGLGLSLNGQQVTLASSSNPGANPAILASDENGGVTLARFGAGVITSHLIAVQTDACDLGSELKLWRKAWISEMQAVLFVENTISAIGGWFIVPHGQGTLGDDVDGTQTQIDFGQAMTPADFIIMRGLTDAGLPKVEYMQVGALVSGTTYSVTRNVDGSGANAWPEGQVYIVLGNTGDGRIELDAQTAGPRISVLEQGTTYNAQTERVRIGDLTGWKSGVSGYGIGIGNPAGTHLYYTPTDGLVIAADGGGMTNIDGGEIQTGTITADQLAANSVTAEEINVATLSAISANLGTVTAGSITGVTASFGGGDVVLDTSGISVGVSALTNYGTKAYRFADTGTVVGAAWVENNNNAKYVTHLDAIGTANSRNAAVELTAFGHSTRSGEVILRTYSGTVGVLGLWLYKPSSGASILRTEVDRVEFANGLSVGYYGDPGGDNVLFAGSLVSRKGSINYDVYGMKMLPTPLTSTSFDGDAKTSANTGIVDLSAVFGAPAGIKSVLLRVTFQATGLVSCGFGPSSTYNRALEISNYVAGGWGVQTGEVPCDANGDIYFLSTTLNQIHVQIYGYRI